jgi:hypothetical protein
MVASKRRRGIADLRRGGVEEEARRGRLEARRRRLEVVSKRRRSWGLNRAHEEDDMARGM